jgi:hypothetical protein
MSNSYLVYKRNKVLLEVLMNPKFHKDKKNFILKEMNNPWEDFQQAQQEIDFGIAVPKQQQEMLIALAKRLAKFNLNDFRGEAQEAIKNKTIEILQSAGEFAKQIVYSIKVAPNLTIGDIKTLAEKDPYSLCLLVLDTISLVDPTGVADITQGAILLSEGIAEDSGLTKFFGALSLVLGFVQAGLTLHFGLVGTPFFLLAKGSIKQAAKALTMDGLRNIITFLAKNSTSILSEMRKYLSIKRFIPIVESLLERAKNFPQSIQKVEEAIKYITNSKNFNSSGIINETVKRQIKLGAWATFQAIMYSASLGASHLRAKEARRRHKFQARQELYMRNVICAKQENKNTCAYVKTDPNTFEVEETENFEGTYAGTYELLRRQPPPEIVDKWYDEVYNQPLGPGN